MTALNSFNLTGDLTLRGVTRNLTAKATFLGPVKAPENLGGEICIGFILSGHLHQEDFGISWNVAMERGGVMVAREIRWWASLEADLETDRQSAR